MGDSAEQQDGPSRRPPAAKRGRGRRALLFWAAVGLAAAAVDRYMAAEQRDKVHRFGYRIDERAAPVEWQDRLDNYMLYEPSAQLLWTYRPSVSYRLECQPQYGEPRRYLLATNSLGLRDGPVSRVKPKGSLRVICIGDSRTAGYGLPLEATFAKQLEGRLRAVLGRDDVDVINAGCDGYTSFQGKRLLRTKLLGLSPDCVVACFSCNDHSLRAQNDVEQQKALSPAGTAAQRLLLRSPLLVAMARPVIAAGRRMGGAPQGRSRMHTPRVGPDEYGKNLLDICAMAKGAGAATVFLELPRYDGDRLEAGRYTEAVARVRLTSGAGAVDMMEDFTEVHASGGQLYLDEVHPNAAGNELIALRLAEWIMAQPAFRSAPRP